MSLVDFTQEACNHGSFNIAVMAVGEASGQLYAAVTDQLSSLPPIPLKDEGTPSTATVVVFPRFLPILNRPLPRWVTDGQRWEEFAPHKQVLGVLVVAQCHDKDDLHNVKVGFKESCDRFQRTLCDSRCVIYGPKKALEGEVDSHKGYCVIDCNVDLESFTKDDVNVDDLFKVVMDFSRMIYITLKSRIASLHRLENLKVLRSPYEEGLQEQSQDSRHLSRAHMQARTMKHLGDLFLLCGQLQEANAHYREAANSLKSHKDFLWLGAAYEGQSVTAILMKKCEEVLGQKAQGTPLSKASWRSFKSPASGGSRTSATFGGRRWGSDRNELKADTHSVRVLKYSSLRRQEKSPSPVPTNFEDEDPLNHFSDGGSGEESGEEDDDDEEGDLIIDERLLQKDFIVDKYTLACLYYNKAGTLGVLSHTEAILKFAKYLVSQKRYAVASETLQRLLRIDSPLTITEQDKVTLYCTMASVYRSMNFHRKAALFTHYAARVASNIATTDQEVYKAHNLLRECLSGYKLSLNPEESSSGVVMHHGWPSLQACILKDFVFLARRRQANMDAIRHTCYLLKMLYRNLSGPDLMEITEMLDDIVTEAHMAQEDNKAVILDCLDSPVSLFEFPCVRFFTPNSLDDILAPHHRAGFMSPGSDCNSQGPFIYSALTARKKKKRPEVHWVKGDPGRISMLISNPLPLELRVERMAIISDGVKVNASPSSLTLPPLSEPQEFDLLCIPLEAGELNILGYEATVFGVHNKCMVKISDNKLVRVIPPLPRLRVTVFPLVGVSPDQKGGGGGGGEGKGGVPQKRSDSSRSSKGSVEKFDFIDGEICKCEFLLDCLRDMPVNKASFSVRERDKTNAEDLQKYCEFSWKEDDLRAALPLFKNELGKFCITIVARVPFWLRINNNIILRPTSSSSEQDTPSINTEQLSTFTPHYLPPSSPTPHYVTPTSSPHVKRSNKKQRSTLLNSSRRKGFNSSEEGLTTNSSLMDSLSLECTLAMSEESRPFQFRQTTSSKSMRISRLSGKRSRPADFDALAYLIDDIDKRASIRSDPGDVQGRQRFNRKVLASDNKPVLFRKPEKAAAGLANLSSDGSTTSIDHELDTERSSPIQHTSPASLVSSLKSSNKKFVKGSISSPVGPVYKCETPERKMVLRKEVKGTFVVEYSGGVGEKEGYYREAVVDFTAHVKPSVKFETFDVLPVEESNELFQLTFNTRNVSKLKLEITFTVQESLGGVAEQTVMLDSNEVIKIVLPLKRFRLSECHTLGITNESNTAKLYCDEIARMVRPSWRTLDNQRRGQVSLEGLRLPLSVINIVRPVPLLFDMKLNGGACPMQGACIEEFQLGTPISAHIRVTNNSGVTMPPSSLILEPYQFSEEQKRIIKDLSGKMLITGDLITNVPKLESGTSFDHRVTILFLYKGVFQLDVKSITASVSEGQQAPSETVDGTLSSSLEGILDESRSFETPQMKEVGERIAGRCSPNLTRAGQHDNPPLDIDHDCRALTFPVAPLIGNITDQRTTTRLPAAQRVHIKTDSRRHLDSMNTHSHSLASSRLGRHVCGPHITFHVV